MVPESGANTPAIMLKQVVFPAPFGPMSATMCPRSTPKLTLDTARTPRKLLHTPCTESSGSVIAAPTALGSDPEPRSDGGPDAVGQEHHHQQQRHAVEHLLHTRNVESERSDQFGDAVGKHRKKNGSEYRSEKRAQSAYDGSEDDFDRAADVKNLLGEKIVVVEREEYPGQRRHPGADHHREHLVAEGVDSQRLGGFLVLADRLPVVTGAAAQQPRAKSECRRGQSQHHVIEH